MAANAKQTPEQRLLLKPKAAAETLGDISERQLWAQTVPRGPIPCVRIGKCVRYSPEALQRFIRQCEAAQQTEEEFRQEVETQFNACLDHPVNAGLKSRLTGSQVLARDISDLGGGPEDGGNHPAGCNCDACDPS